MNAFSKKIKGLKLATGIAFLLLPIAVTGCREDSVNISTPVNPRGWKPDDVKSVIYRNSDTTSLRNIVLFLSCDKNLKGNIPLEITTVTPDSMRFTEGFMFESSDEAGGDFTVKRAEYRNDNLFSREGGYVFRIRQTGSQPIKGIRAVGIEIESAIH